MRLRGRLVPFRKIKHQTGTFMLLTPRKQDGKRKKKSEILKYMVKQTRRCLHVQISSTWLFAAIHRLSETPFTGLEKSGTYVPHKPLDVR